MEPVHPLATLVEDAWVEVLRNVGTPKDILSMAHSNSFFRYILQNNPDLQQKWKEAALFVAIPHLSHYLDQDEVLNFRLVSRGTKASVDYYLLKEFRKHTTTTKFPRLKLWKTVFPEADRSLVRIMLEMGALPIAKMVQVDFNCWWNNNNADLVLWFMEQLGTQIGVLNIWYAERQTFDHFEALEFVKNVLALTPNVTYLSITIEHKQTEPGIPNKLLVQQVEEFWEKTTLPELPHLEHLELWFAEGRSQFPSYALPSAHAFLNAYGAKIKQLKMPRSRPYYVKILPILSVLEVHLYSLEDLETLSALEAPRLKDIRVCLYGSRNPVLLEMLFWALEKGKPALTDLRIEVASRLDNWNLNDFPAKVSLPLVKGIILQGHLYGPTWPFIENFPKLRRLSLRLPVGFPNTLLNSMWKSLPELQEVVVLIENGNSFGQQKFARSSFQEE